MSSVPAPSPIVGKFDGTPTASATSVFSGSYNAGGNLSLNTVVNYYASHSDQPEAYKPSAASKWLAELASVNQYGLQKQIYEKVAVGTCKWIIETPEFNSWISRESGIFWGVGIPGAGKTVLTSFVINYLGGSPQSQNDENPIAFVYCRYTDELSLCNVLAALLQQVIDKSSLVLRDIEEGIYAKCTREDTRPTSSELVEALTTAFRLVQGAIVVLDALDELDELVREDVVNTLSSLPVRLFMTSRELNLNHINQPSIQIQAPREDLKMFINRELSRLPKLWSLLRDRREVLDEVVDQIEAKADSMFLLSALQVSALRGVTSIESLRRSIAELPTDLAGMYELTVARIRAQSDEEASLALKAILWVAYASRPLKTLELTTALSVEAGVKEVNEDALTNDKILISICCGLLECREETGPRLIHYTAHDFFRSQTYMPFGNAHSYIVETCIVYLELHRDDTDSLIERQTAIRQIESSNHPLSSLIALMERSREEEHIKSLTSNKHLLTYALHELGYHVSQTRPSEISGLVNGFLLGRRTSLIYPLYISRDYFPGHDIIDICNILHYAAVYGLLSYLKEHFYVNDPYERSNAGLTILMYACLGGHMPIVEFLLQTGKADVDAVHDIWQTQFTALHLAVSVGNLSLVRRLIDYGASPRIGDMIWSATIYRQTEVLQVLLDQPDMDINRVANGSNALFFACRSGYIEAVELLVAHKQIDLSLPHEFGGALHAAIECRRIAIIEILLNHPQTDLCIQDRFGYTILHKAVNRDGILQKLLDSQPVCRLIINAQDMPNGETVLHRANNVEDLRALLDYEELDVNIRDNLGRTALHRACYNGSTNLVEVFVSHPSGTHLDHLNAPTYSPKASNRIFGSSSNHPSQVAGLTALDIAILENKPEIISILAGAGAKRTRCSISPRLNAFLDRVLPLMRTICLVVLLVTAPIMALLQGYYARSQAAITFE